MSQKSGGIVDDKGKYVVLLKKDASGDWWITHAIYNSDLPLPAARGEEVAAARGPRQDAGQRATLELSGIVVRGGTAADRDFVIDTARRFAAFGPPPWRSALEVVAGEVRCLDDFFDGRLERPGGPACSSPNESGDPLGFAFLEPAVDYFSGERTAMSA